MNICMNNMDKYIHTHIYTLFIYKKRTVRNGQKYFSTERRNNKIKNKKQNDDTSYII